jgi:hypothetical protein
MNLVFVADFPDDLQGGITLLGHFKTLPTRDLAVLRTLENLLVQLFLFHNDPFLDSVKQGNFPFPTSFP